jgi:hypothetical protein
MAPFPVEAPEMPAQFSAIWFGFIMWIISIPPRIS